MHSENRAANSAAGLKPRLPQKEVILSLPRLQGIVDGEEHVQTLVSAEWE